MVTRNVAILLGQSNMEGQASKLTLPASLRGPQALVKIYNIDNDAIETLDVDGVGANLPNNTTAHTAGVCGPEMSFAEAAAADLGEIYLFKYAIASSCLVHIDTLPSWHPHSNDEFANFKTKFTAFDTRLTAAGDDMRVVLVAWLQGETESIITGTSESYEGALKYFIEQVRTFLLGFSVPTAV